MLFMPTSDYSVPIQSLPRLAKGQLYNLDSNCFIGFQFNPEKFDYRREFNWAVNSCNGDESGGDLLYLNSGPFVFDLALLFIADPGAPEMEYDTANSLSSPDLKMDFRALAREINDWMAIIPSLGRPSRIRVIFGELHFDGVVTSLELNENNHFPDLSVREGLIELRFREWRQMRSAS